MDLGDLKVRISADISELSRGVQRAQAQMQAMGSKMRSVGSSMQGVGKSMSLAVTAPILLMGKLGLDELKDIQSANAQTAAAIRNVGKGSLISAGHIRKQAGALQQLSGADDQAIQSAQNLLLRFANLNVKTREGADAFDRAARLAVDMGVTMGGPETAAKKLGKALADPANALTRVGKEAGLTKAQMERIKKQMEGVNTPAQKQAILLTALESKYKGAGAAAGETLGAKLAILQDRVAGVAAKFLEKLIPAVDVLVSGASRLLGWVERLSPAQQKWGAVAAVVAAAMGPLLIIAGAMVSAIGALVTVVGLVSAPMLLAAAGIAAVAVGLVLLYKKSETARAVVSGLWAILKASPFAMVIRAVDSMAQKMGGWRDVMRYAGIAALGFGVVVLTMARSVVRAVSDLAGSWLQKFASILKALAFVRPEFKGVATAVEGMASKSKSETSAMEKAMTSDIGKMTASMKRLKDAIDRIPAFKSVNIQIRTSGTNPGDALPSGPTTGTSAEGRAAKGKKRKGGINALGVFNGDVGMAAVLGHSKAAQDPTKVFLKERIRLTKQQIAGLIATRKRILKALKKAKPKAKPALRQRLIDTDAEILALGGSVASDQAAIDDMDKDTGGETGTESSTASPAADTPAETVATDTPSFDSSAGGGDTSAADALAAQAQARADAAQANYDLSQSELAAFRGMQRPVIEYHINALSGYDPAVQRAMANASNGGFSSGGLADRMYSARSAV